MTLPTVRIGRRTFTILYPNLLRPLTDGERQTLKNAIRKFGVQVPVVIDRDNGIIDGANRAQIAAELGLKEIPLDIQPPMGDELKAELALALNDARRHLTPAERKKLKDDRVQRTAEARTHGESLRSIAQKENVSHTQIVNDLKEATVKGFAVDPPSGRIAGRDGRERPAHREAPPNPPPRPTPSPPPAKREQGPGEIPPQVRPEIFDAFSKLWAQMNEAEKAFFCRLIMQK